MFGRAKFIQQCLRNALAVVFDGEGDHTLAMNADLSTRTSRVPVDVTQTLLQHAEQHQFHLGRQTAELGVYLEFLLRSAKPSTY